MDASEQERRWFQEAMSNELMDAYRQQRQAADDADLAQARRNANRPDTAFRQPHTLVVHECAGDCAHSNGERP